MTLGERRLTNCPRMIRNSHLTLPRFKAFYDAGVLDGLRLAYSDTRPDVQADPSRRTNRYRDMQPTLDNLNVWEELQSGFLAAPRYCSTPKIAQFSRPALRVVVD